jgi:hypothetical protein
LEVTVSQEEWRELTPEERSVIRRILEKEFRGRDALREQVERARARTVDETGSIEIEVPGDARSDALPGLVPVYARVPDADGFEIEIQLFVRDGKLSELLMCKEDGSAILQYPVGSGLRIS